VEDHEALYRAMILIVVVLNLLGSTHKVRQSKPPALFYQKSSTSVLEQSGTMLMYSKRIRWRWCVL